MMGHYTYKGLVRVLCEDRAQIGRYAADHGVAFPGLLNTDKSQLQHTKLCLLSNKSHGTEMVRGTCPTIVASYR